MKSLIVGIARTGTPTDYLLNRNTQYISMCGSKPEVNFSINCGQEDFLEKIYDLRYNDADPSSSTKAISFFQELTTQIIKDLKYIELDENQEEPLHIRLVVTPFELAQIPFEFSGFPDEETNKKVPLLANTNRIITLTREVRQESEAGYEWPSKPRILFAWAEPDSEKMPVPHKDHLNTLENILKELAKPSKENAYPVPDISEFLTELPNASLESIKTTLEGGNKKGKPYTHIHILAHGGQKLVYGTIRDFRLILCQNDKPDVADKVDGEALSNAIISLEQQLAPAIISLAVCDSANTGNTILSTGSLTNQLHIAGIPCVFASQFPLTQSGSIIMVEKLYHSLIHGMDPRLALYQTRLELVKEQSHDWASLIAYARFPEDIDQQLRSTELKMLFNEMKTTNAWLDHTFKFWKNIENPDKNKLLKELDLRLENSISKLSNRLNGDESTLENNLLQREHLGLLGSAYKRKAEFAFRSIVLNPDEESNLIESSIKCIEKAKHFYQLGFHADPGSHWNTMQYLSLKAISKSSLINDTRLWHATEYMAIMEEEKAKNENDKVWAWGTLAELYLLQPLITLSPQKDEEIILSTQKAKQYLKKMADLSNDYNYAKESTARQFERYIHWWPHLFRDTFPNWIKESAIEIRSVLPSLEILLT